MDNLTTAAFQSMDTRPLLLPKRNSAWLLGHHRFLGNSPCTSQTVHFFPTHRKMIQYRRISKTETTSTLDVPAPKAVGRVRRPGQAKKPEASGFAATWNQDCAAGAGVGPRWLFFLAGGCRGHAPEALTFDHQVTKGTSTSVADVPGTFLDVFGLDGWDMLKLTSGH